MAPRKPSPEDPAQPARERHQPSSSTRRPEKPGSKPGASKKESASAVRTTARPGRASAAGKPPARPNAAPPSPGARPPGAAPAKRAARRAERPPDALDIVMVASEAHPFATTGGLAEVVGALPRALARLGHKTTVILPRYKGMQSFRPGRSASGPSEAAFDMGARRQTVKFHRRRVSDGVDAVFVDAPELFHRDGIYGTADGDYPDNDYRFAVLSRAAIEYIRLSGTRPSVIHTHDWHAGLVPAYQKMLFSHDPVVGGVPAVFTIHNLAFQGLYPASRLDEIGLPWEVMHVEAMEFWGQISYLKAGINFSERITTVSPGYAAEILSPEMGFGFEGVLARRAGDLRGIVNGIDTERWNPEADPFVPVAYSAGDLAGKRQAKRLLLEDLKLAHDGDALRRPVVGLVSRLTDQKGFDLIAAAMDDLMALDAGWVMLGSGDRRYEEQWTMIASRYPDRVSATIGYDERLEHLIEAGADMFLMPSRFEPCGLNQLNSLRYGTLPIVRATGGLDDTVADPDTGQGPATGFKFSNYTPEALMTAMRRALEAYGRPDDWAAMQRAAMQQDYSWDVSAREYVKVYRPHPED